MIVSIFNDFKGKIHKNLSVDELYSYALSKKEGVLSHNGTLVVTTGKYTGRSPKDRFIVDTPDISGLIDWDEVNLSMSEEKFDILYNHLIESEELPNVETVTLDDWHNVLAQNEDGIEGLVTTYEMAEIEDTTLRDEINEMLESDGKLNSYIDEANLINSSCNQFFGKGWNLHMPKIENEKSYLDWRKTDPMTLGYHLNQAL